MKKKNLKLIALITALMMMLSLAACGGGSGDGGASGEPAAEANAGVRNLVFAVPDGWELNGISPGSYLSFGSPESDADLVINAMTQEDLESYKSYDSSITASTLQEYFDTFGTESADEMKERHVEFEKTTACGTDAVLYKAVKDDGSLTEKSTDVIIDDAIYYISLYSPNSYNSDRSFNNDAVSLTDSEIAAYDALVASAKQGDGESFLKEMLKADSLGSIAFEAPAGYSVTNLSENYVEFTKDGSDVKLTVNRTTEDGLQYIEYEDGSHPESLEAEFSNITEYAEDDAKTTIAGYDGYIFKYPDENGEMTNCSAGFMTEDAIYDIYIQANMWDDQGNMLEDAEPLTDEDIAVFDSFVSSLTKK